MDQLTNGSFLMDLIIDPVTRERLLFDPESNTLVGSKSGNRISFIESVPGFIIEEN